MKTLPTSYTYAVFKGAAPPRANRTVGVEKARELEGNKNALRAQPELPLIVDL